MKMIDDPVDMEVQADGLEESDNTSEMGLEIWTEEHFDETFSNFLDPQAPVMQHPTCCDIAICDCKTFHEDKTQEAASPSSGAPCPQQDDKNQARIRRKPALDASVQIHSRQGNHSSGMPVSITMKMLRSHFHETLETAAAKIVSPCEKSSMSVYVTGLSAGDRQVDHEARVSETWTQEVAVHKQGEEEDGEVAWSSYLRAGAASRPESSALPGGGETPMMEQHREACACVMTLEFL
eukprot:756174-Hanusia_phi.AAC.3